MAIILNPQQMSGLKKSNLSKAPEKTKMRIAEDFKSQSNAVKNQIEELSGLSRAAIRNAYGSGVVSAKIVLALAQVLDVSPFYYTGVIDEKGDCSKETLTRFLTEHGYDALAGDLQDAEKPIKRKYNRKPKAESAPQLDTPAATEVAVETEQPVTAESIVPQNDSPQEPEKITISLTLSDTPEMREAIAKLTLDNATLLLNSLFIRAAAGGENAVLCDVVKRILLS